MEPLKLFTAAVNNPTQMPPILALNEGNTIGNIHFNLHGSFHNQIPRYAVYHAISHLRKAILPKLTCPNIKMTTFFCLNQFEELYSSLITPAV